MGGRQMRVMTYVILGAALAWVGSRAATALWDPDAWWQLRLGNDLIAQRSLSTPAHWSSFASVTWVPTQPLPEIVAAFVQRAFGYPGLAWLYGAATVLLVATIQVTNRREAGQLPATVATMAFLLPAYGSMTPRPQLISFALLAVVIAAWLQSDRDLRPRWWLVPLTWLWSMSHGFWFIGAAYGFLFVLGIALSRRADVRTLMRLACVPVASLLVVLLNPAGIGVFEAPFRVNAVAPYITEWQRTQLLSAGPMAALLLVALTALLWVVTGTRVSWSRCLVLMSAVFWVWYAERLVVVGAVVAVPLLAGALEGLIARSQQVSQPPEPRGAGRRELAVIAGMVVAVLAVLATVVPHTSAEPGRIPLALDEDLDQLPAGTPVINGFDLGGWLAWRHPDLEQYIDGLADAYSPEHFRGYIRMIAAEPGWRAVVRHSGAHVAILKQSAPLTGALRSAGWSVRGTDGGYVLLQAPGYRP